ncbi:MAG: hypothetical protein VYE22_00925 [Myxococcota bacterium]|nr:hypothetical protein [Myxococcota bacterium]
MGFAFPSYMRRCLLLCAFILVPACATPEPAVRDGDALAVSVDAFPVDCMIEQTLRTGPTAEVRISSGEDGFEVWLDEENVTADFSGGPGEVAIGEVAVPAETPVRLRVTRASVFECTVRLVQRASVEEALDRLRAESAHEVAITESDETGAPANVTLRVGTTGDTPSARAADFLARHALAFGAPADQLVESAVEVAPDGWATVRFDQVIDGVPGHRAGIDIEMDPEGVVVSVHARLFVGVDAAPSFTSTEAEAREAAAEAGDIAAAFGVLFDPARPRAAWQVDGSLRQMVIEDGSLEVLESFSTFDEASVEIHRPTPTPLPGSSRDHMTGHRRVAAASSSGGPPTGLTSSERQVWSWMARIAESVRARSGQDGWRATSHPAVNISQLSPGGVRIMMEPTSVSPSAGWYSYGLVYLGTRSAGEAAVVCHEYGHALHDTLRRHRAEPGAIKEAVADAFWVFCDPWLTGSRRSGYRGQNFQSPPGRPDQSNYDAFLRAGLNADMLRDAGYDVHDHTYLISTPFYRMLQEYDMPVQRAEHLMYFTLGYNRSSSTERFRQFRDAIVQQADAWAQSGRHGFTAADACSVARAFRDVKLDGEYGRSADATCGPPGGREDRYVCTNGYCPLCPVQNPNPCDREPRASEPHCVAPGLAGAGDRRICVGGIVLHDQGCSRGSVRHCSCRADGSWECPGTCRRPEGLTYCPETAGASGGYTRTNPNCGVATGDSTRHGWLLGLALAALVFVRRRRG